jgi:hypothetical protein
MEEKSNYPFNLVDTANEDIRKYGKEIQIVRNEDDGYYSIDILTVCPDGTTKSIYTFAENLFENELADFVNDAWANVRKREMLKKQRQETKRRMDDESLYCKICRTLTDFEEGCDYDIEEALYLTLVDVQNWMCAKGFDGH